MKGILMANLLAGMFAGGGAPGLTYSVIIAGDSNATGYVQAGYVPEAPNTLSNLRQIPYQTPHTAVLADDPLDFPPGIFGANIAKSSVLSAYRVIAAADPDNNYVVIPSAEPSTALDVGGVWDPTTGDNYLISKDQIGAMFSQFSGAIVTDMYWCGYGRAAQNGFPEAESETTLNALIAQYKTDVSNSAMRVTLINNPPLYVSGFNTDGGVSAKFEVFESFLKEKPITDDNTIFVAGPLRVLDVDNWFNSGSEVSAVEAGTDNHYSPEAETAIGPVIAALRPLINGLTSSAPSAPLSVSSAGNGFVSFEIPASGFHKAVVRYRDDGTADPWVEVDRYPYWSGQVPGETYVSNVPTTSPAAQEAQVKLVSRGGESSWSSSVVLPAVQRSRGWRVRVTATNGNVFTNAWQIMFNGFTGGPDMGCAGVVISGPVYLGTSKAYYAFDARNAAPEWVSEDGGAGAGTAWLGIYFDEPTFVGAIKWASRGDGATQASDQAPNALNLERSAVGDTLSNINAGTASWSVVWSVSGQTGWSDDGETREFSI